MSEVDKLITRRGPDHQKSLKDISIRLRQAVLGENEIFSAFTDTQIKRFERERVAQFPDILFTTYQLYLSSEASKAPGHEATHIVDVLSSAARIFEEFQEGVRPLSEVEKLEISLALIAHDVGRYAEPYFHTGREDLETNNPGPINERDLEILIPLMMGRKAARQIGIPQVLGDRILYDIASGSVPQTGHLVADIVHQCDREQLGGAVMIPRLVALGIGSYGMDFVVPPIQEMSSHSTDLPNIYRVPVDKLLTRLEFWMRNVYLPISPQGRLADQQRQVETAVVLMLGLHEMNAETKIVFAPELGAVDSSKLSQTKKPLPEEVFKEARREYQVFLSTVEPNSYTNEQSLGFARKLMLIEGTVAPKDFDQRFKDVQAMSTPKVNRNRWLIMLYALQKRHQKRLHDIKQLGAPKNGVAEAVKDIVLENLGTREAIFKHAFRIWYHYP